MSGPVKAEDVASAIEESARLLGATYSREKVWPILTEFEEAFTDGMIVFSAQTGERYAGRLDYSFSVPLELGDPYARALSNGFIAETDHPVNSLLAGIQEKCSISNYMVDCEADGGLTKLYAHFPHDLQKVSSLADIPSMPRAVAENADFFARHGLDNVAMIGIGYESKTMSVYFQFDAESRPEPKAIGSMLREIGIPEPDERTLEYACKSLRANITLGWDSPDIIRVALAPPPTRGLGPSAVPAPVPPNYARFATTAPRAYDDERVNIFAFKWTRDAEYLEVCSYYQVTAMQRKLFIADRKEQA
jgi:hypothetical protein